MNTATVRDLIPVRDRDVQQRLQEAAAVVQAWAAQWLPAEAAWQPQLAVGCSTAAPLTDVPPVWAHACDAARARLAALLVGRAPGLPLSDDDWASQAAGSALADLHARMSAKAWGLAQEGRAPDLRKLSGAIVVTESSLGLHWVWQSSPVTPPQSGQTAALTDCVKTQQVRLSAGLGEVEIAVADLLALQMGDVIRFPALLKAPVPLALGTDGEMKASPLSAQLGEWHGRVAIKLSSVNQQ